MKKSIVTTGLLVLLAIGMSAQSDGTLTVRATTSEAGGYFAPRNVVAIWIEDNAGSFVKTLLAYAEDRKTHLNTWQAASTYNVVDAITGATQDSHAARSCTWNGTDVSGNVVADGTYKVWMELTDKNSTGNYSSFSFTKGGSLENLTPANVPSFSSIVINWTPVATAVNDAIKVNCKIYPNPSSGIFNISGDHVKHVEVRNISGALIYAGTSAIVDISDKPNGIYLINVKTSEGAITQKIIKR